MTRAITYLRLAARSIIFNWRIEASVFFGAAIAAAVLTGAMLVGDSVSYSLHESALLRLGNIQHIVQSSGRFFDAELAARLSAETGTPFAPVLQFRGVVSMDGPDGRPVQVNNVQVIGVDSSFWQFSSGPAVDLGQEHIAINFKLAAQLGAGIGDDISLRLQKPSMMPRDAPLSSREDKFTVRGTFAVREVISDDRLGRFSLSANQIEPCNVFVDLAWLQEVMEIPARANLLLSGPPEGGADVDTDKIESALKKSWKLTDAGLRLRPHDGVLQLESDRVFIDPAVSAAALSLSNSVGAIAYMVNRIGKGARSTPYSFAAAVSPTENRLLGLVPAAMRDDEVIINEWLARHLDAQPGDRITVAYYKYDAGRLKEHEQEFSVREVMAMDAFQNEARLMPHFPGLSDVDKCADWDVGMQMDEEALRDKDNQEYWESYRTAPKIVFTLKAGRQMWSNRFGDTTGVRFDGERPELPARQLADAIKPASVGIVTVPVRENALRAVEQAMSFSELFISMSSFLILAALLLTAMLFVFGVQQRSEELGLLLGVGWQPGAVRSLFLSEGSIVALAGSIAGGLLGTGYTRLLIKALATHWKGAVSSAAIQYHAEPITIAAGIVTSFLCAAAAMAAAMRRQARRPARELLSGDLAQGQPGRATRAACIRTFILSSVAFLAAAGTAVFAAKTGQQDAVYAFFGAGFLLLISGLGFARLLLQAMEIRSGNRLNLTAIGIRNASRRGGRSLTTIALLGCGSFIVFGVSAMQQDLASTAPERWSGTGGFALFGEVTLPVPDEIETDKMHKAFGLDREESLTTASFISIKVHDGDDASCFNLNRAQSPRLLGIDPARMAEQGAFMPPGAKDGRPWSLLGTDLPEGVIPGLAGDANTAMWNLQKRADPESGDEILYTDERGEPFRVKLVGTLPVPLSIFQGTVIVAKDDFNDRYPSEPGYRMFLADLPSSADAAAAGQALSRRLERIGADVTTTLSRLMEFHSVESTYLSMFLVLGGLGVVLGTFGLSVVVLRNMLERRAELALLRCVGFSRKKILWLVLAEHWMLLIMGLTCGLVSSAVAIYPSLAAPGMHVPMRAMALILAGILAAGLASTILAALIALRGELVPALRKE